MYIYIYIYIRICIMPGSQVKNHLTTLAKPKDKGG